jgi:ubiquitin C-terminal hydrolase
MHAALLVLLDLLEKDLDRIRSPRGREANIIPLVFRFGYQTVCHSVEGHAVLGDRSGTFSDYSLELEPPEGTVSLLDCIRAFTMEERMTGDEGYAIRDSDGNVIRRIDATRVTCFTDFPPVLCIHLKRYWFDHEHNCLVKKQTTVEFSESLEIGEDMSGTEQLSARYALRAMVTHGGVDNGGHFMAYVSVEGQWWACSDLSTRRVDLSDVLAAEAYVLFYENPDSLLSISENSLRSRGNTM